MIHADVIIIGAGIAGASLACFLAESARIIMLEAEYQPGYHATGRSAAFYSESYGGPQVQPLTAASKSFFFDPPAGFAEQPLVRPRGALHVARHDQQASMQAMLRAYAPLAPALRAVGKADLDALAPMLKPDWGVAGVYDPDCKDIDVNALHAGFLRAARRHGATLQVQARVEKLQYQNGRWHVQTADESYDAPVVVNAAGAWGDEIAQCAGFPPLGLQPMCRTIITCTPESFSVLPDAPLVLDMDEAFYFKPDGQTLWASPADETPMPPCDVQPEDLTVARTVAAIESATHYTIPRIARRWAGLRTFAPDRAPVLGFAPGGNGFFWCVGQGGFGIQTAPAAGRLCAALIRGAPLPDDLTRSGVTAARYASGRF